MVHLKRLAAPKSWPMEKRKGLKFIARPLPGSHKLNESITLNQILIEMLKYAKNKREVKFILNRGKILVNNKTRKESKFSVGLFDTVAIPDNKEFYIMLYDRYGKFFLKSLKEEETLVKICKIICKTILKESKTQLNFHNGNNILVNKDVYKVGDTLVIKGNKVMKHLKLEKCALVYLIGGKSRGKVGVLEKIERFSELSDDIITIKSEEKKITTTKKYGFVIEKEFK